MSQPRSLITIVIFILSTVLPGLMPAAQATSVEEASSLMRKGEPQAALDQLDSLLKDTPTDAPARFLKGILLAELNRVPEAIQIFTALTRDRPELPEPYNNLAVLYAAQGQFDEARKQLELAIRTHPSYAVAHENLGDIYAKMASMAYGKALQLDQANTSAQTKLELIRDLFTPATKTPTKAPTLVAHADTPPTAISTSKVKCKKDRKGRKKCTPIKVPTPKKPSPPTPVVMADPSPPPTYATPTENPPVATATPAAATPKPASVTIANPLELPAAPAPALAGAAKPAEASIASLLEAWAQSWSQQDTTKYLAFYDPSGFKPQGGKSFEEWARERRERIAAPKFIKVQVYKPKISVEGDSASATFKQFFNSDRLKNDWTRKTIDLRHGPDGWKIVGEH